MLIKELIETEEITGSKAIWTIARLTYHVKTPTPELLRQLVVRYYKTMHLCSMNRVDSSDRTDWKIEKWKYRCTLHLVQRSVAIRSSSNQLDSIITIYFFNNL